MTEAQRVGQLLMVDCPSTGASDAALDAIARYHVGSIILDGNSGLSVSQTREVTDQLRRASADGVGLFVATDQEGGTVQRLRGPGFDRIPSAVDQGQRPLDQLQQDATTWGRQMSAAGVNIDLAPVLDTVPPGGAPNPPIGDLDREFGHDPDVVSAHGLAVTAGLARAGVDSTVKHFPGLGRVTGNTDTDGSVVDTVTTRHDAYLAPFAAAVAAGVPLVMVSTAIYERIDPNRPAAFSPTIVTGMLRGDLGYRGVIISDDLGAADQVSGYTVGDRAVNFVAAGGDLVLTVDSSQAPTMTSALLARAQADPGFRKQVDAAALRILRAKLARGLLR
jgi:beta-N-acetylhexosaminidase